MDIEVDDYLVPDIQNSPIEPSTQEVTLNKGAGGQWEDCLQAVSPGQREVRTETSEEGNCGGGADHNGQRQNCSNHGELFDPSPSTAPTWPIATAETRRSVSQAFQSLWTTSSREDTAVSSPSCRKGSRGAELYRSGTS